VYYGDARYRKIKDILDAALDREPLPEVLLPGAPQVFTFARPSTDFFGATPEVKR
jgi:hypothetical protein